MTKRLLIDASHAEETRVVVLDGNRLEDFDVETLSRRQLKGNIYLAKVVRVEPSLQAAFVEYGGNRHGFLAFGEVHPDYYQIPVADRQRLIALQEEEARADEDEDEDSIPYTSSAVAEKPARAPAAVDASRLDAVDSQPLLFSADPLQQTIAPEADDETAPLFESLADKILAEETPAENPADLPDLGADSAPETTETVQAAGPGEEVAASTDGEAASAALFEQGRVRQVAAEDDQTPETVGGDLETVEEARPPRQTPRFLRSYKIQEVIRRRQILLVQVVKEERGSKGAALTTYISLAGRYCVLMPNSPRGGGISRKITSVADRRRLKEVTAELEIPRGMGLIVRTAGAARPKPEISRDGEYLLRMWDDIRERTMQSMAPALIHEEASLIKRAIRDVYSRDIDELLVDGQDGWRAARDYMRMLMPTHVKKVQLWPSAAQPLFAHSQVESMLDSMLSPTVQLRSGGYLVINQTEALVAIDVNSGRSTRERGIEETALRTNLEAAEEAARQLRLRDLAGLIVIDFIDMESSKHNAMVERRMADALRHDRARIQMGRISHFGLLELSRQRLRPSLAETSLNVCAQCGGTGHVRSTESASLHVLREIEEEGGKRRAAEILVHVAGATALFILNNKRQRLTEIEARYGMTICFAADETLLPAQTRIDKIRAALPQDLPAVVAPEAQSTLEDDAGEADMAEDEDDLVMGQTRVEAGASASMSVAGDFTTDTDHIPGETAAEGEQRRRRRRRRRRGPRREDGAALESAAPMPDGAEQPDIPDLGEPAAMPVSVPGHDGAAEAAETLAHQTLTPETLAPETLVPETLVPETPALKTPAPETPAPETSALDAPAGSEPGVEEPVKAVPPEAPPIEGEAEPGRAKRGRRGGRRRRKPGEDDEAAMPATAETPAPMPSPAYVGPTPADPFAMAGLDIFDALEQAEMRPLTSVVAEAPQPPEQMDSVPLSVSTKTLAMAEPKALVVAAAPQPPAYIEVEQAAAEAVAGAAPASGQAASPAIQPILVGSAAPTAERKKGWWRR